MAILITAPVGTGKTLKSIELCFEYLNEGREVFTNIIGIKVSGVRVIESNALNPFDWRDLPPGSVLIFDEAHEHPAFSERDLLRNFKIEYWENELRRITRMTDISDTKRKSLLSETKEMYSRILKDEKEKIMDIGLSMSMHRHFNQEIVLITQNPTKLNKDVLGNVTIHHVMRRKFGFEAATIWTFGEAMTTWGKSVADSALVKKQWNFPKHLFKFYTSAEGHNVKKYFPKKYYAIAMIPVLLFGTGIMKAKETGFFGIFGGSDTQVSDVKPEPILIQEGDTRTQAEILEQHAADQAGMSLEQYRASQNPTLQNLDFECRKAENLSRPECVQWFDNLSKTNSSVTPSGNVIQTVSYNPAKPYDFEYAPQVQPKDFPRMSGVITLSSGRLMAIDQQGGYMANISQEDCKRWLSGDRPFNYFKDTQQQPQQVQQQPTYQENPEYQKAYIEYLARREAERAYSQQSTERVSTSDSGNQNFETSSL